MTNILFIMCDQLRHDYLSCAGHPHLHTPHIDALAARGVRFTNAHVQSPVCGASRMSFYTGRYVSSHGAKWNNFPLKVGEMTLGDHLRPLGMGAHLVGKTHMKADDAGLERLGIARDGIIGARLAECGFDAFVRDDGLWAEGPDGFYDARRSPYNEHLRARGYTAANPWADHANAGRDAEGRVATGWLMQNAHLPAAVDEPDSETPWLTDQAIAFMQSEAAQAPWLMHLSYIKPHWPYIVPAPYHAMYGPEHVLPAIRAEAELDDPHPVLAAFMQNAPARAFAHDEVRARVIPAYMGLVKQIDDQIGRLMAWMDETGRLEDTVIVLTSDHGDYLGDHWLGEKDLFHAPSVKVPLIVADPRASADATRGTTCDALVEAIDLAATFVEIAGGEVPGHIIEGRSLMPFIEGRAPGAWRQYVVSEYDYSVTGMAERLGLAPRDARLFMVATHRWKLVHAEGGFRPMLHDLAEDPDELVDLGASPAHEPVLEALYAMLFEWARRESQRTTVSDAEILARRAGKGGRTGVLIGAWDEADVHPDDLAPYQGR